MSLGIQIDNANTGSSGVEATANATGSPGNPGNPANRSELFGQLMAKAMQLQSQADTLPGQTEAAASSAQLTEDGLLQDMAGAKDTEEAGRLEDELTLSLPDWLQPWPGMPNVQQISVGPSMQAITAGTSTPDAQGVADFARQQGLDADAIAWLMNPSRSHVITVTGKLPSTTGPQTILDGTTLSSTSPQGAPLLNTLVAGSALLPPASVAALHSGVTAITPGGPGQAALAQGEFAGSGAWALSASNPETADSKVLNQENDPGTGIALTQMNRSQTSASVQVLTSPGTVDGKAQESNTDSATNIALAQLRWTQTHAPSLVDPANTTTVENMGQEQGTDATTNIALAQLRWSQTHAPSLVNPARTAQMATSGQPGQSNLNESTLDLTSLFTTESKPDLPAPPDPLDSDGVTPSGSGSGMADAAGWHRASGSATHARTESAGLLSSTSTMTPDQLEQMSEQMADAIGERMLREIERGHWNVRLMLKPAHLGHIEVEMRLRAGELDATFAAPQAATRELLQDGLSRLKDSLGQAGMDVANLHVRDGQNRQNGGDSTPGQGQFANNAKTTSGANAPVQSTESPPRPRRTDGWDVMV